MYEIASGYPPYPRVEPGRKLGVQLVRQPPRLDNSPEYSEGLKGLVAFVLESKAVDRPSMESILEHSYVKDSEVTHPTESLAELVKAFYRWENSGGQRTSLFFGGGAAAAQFPDALEADEDWNFSTTAGFEQQFTEANPGQAITSVFGPTLSQHSIAASDFAHTAGYSSDNYLPHSKAHPPELSPKSQFDMSDQNFDPHPLSDSAGVSTEFTAHDFTEAMTPQETAQMEARIKRGEKALQGLFDEKQEPYQYGPKTEIKDQQPVPAVGRARSDLPLRDDSSESSIHHKELIITHKPDGTMELPNIDLADTNTIKPGGLTQFLGTMGGETNDEDEYKYGQHSDADKRATMDWKFPSQPEVTVTATEDVDEGARDQKRDTTAWTFPAEAMAPKDDGPNPSVDNLDVDNPAPIQVRPALRHVATAPAASDLRQSIGGMLDLDAIYDSEPYDNDIYASDAFRTAPNSDEESVPRQPTTDQHTPVVSADENISPNTPWARDSATFTDSDDSDYHPFKFARTSDDKLKDKINAYLDEKGVTDVMERAALRGDLMKSRKGLPAFLARDMDEEGFGEFKKRDWTPALGQYSGRVLGKKTWDKYNPSRNPAQGYTPYPIGEPARIGDPDFPAPGPLRTNFGGSGSTQGNAAAADLADVQPPSAAAMRQDAPAHVVEAELRRLLQDFDGTLGSLGEFFDAHASGLGNGNAGAGRGQDGNGSA